MTALPDGQWAPVPDHSDLAGVPDALRREGAHLPPPLPSVLPLPVSTYGAVAEAEHALGRLDEAVRRLPVRAGFVRTTRVRDAHASATLAGAAVGLRAALAADLADRGLPLPGGTASTRFVSSFLAAHDHGLARVRSGAVVDAAVIGEMAAILAGREGADVLRRDHGWLGPRPEDAYLLTASGAHLVALLEQWSTWVREERAQPRLARIALAHHRLEVLRPFPCDGGRVARAYSTLELVRSGLLHDHLLPLSVWLDDAHEEYREEVRAVVDTGSVHHWVEFFAVAVRDQALAQLRLVGRLEALLADYARRLPRGGTLPAVAAELVGHPVVDHRTLRARHDVTMRAATGVTGRLVDLGILLPLEARGYRRVFVCQDVLELLADDPVTTAPPR